MAVYAAVTTGKGTGAISTIQIFGDSSETVIKKIFEPAGGKPVTLETGKTYLGTIKEATDTIDQVTLGCEGSRNFAIHCHGNPLIVADIMQLLQRHGAKLSTAEELLCKIFSMEKPSNTIALEARLARLRAKTLQGTKIIANQIDTGLSKKVLQWLQNIKTIPLDKIKSDAEQILKNSKAAKLIIFGCKIALSGPPNTGKSTLLNFLAGRQKAIVTEIKGTTRDWVSAQCRIGPLSAELIDTAGLAEISKDTIEKKSQQKSVEILNRAELVLLVLDNSQTIEQLDEYPPGKITGKKVLTVLNKCDLPAKFDTGKLPGELANTVQISAKFGTGINTLCNKILQICNIADFDLQAPVCFTSRHENLLKRLKKAKSKEQAAQTITELLNGLL